MAFDPSVTLGDVKTEVDSVLATLIAAGQAVEKFDVFLPATTQTEIAGAVTILTEVKSVLDKL
jgi:hypothetical protein